MNLSEVADAAIADARPEAKPKQVLRRSFRLFTHFASAEALLRWISPQLLHRGRRLSAPLIVRMLRVFRLRVRSGFSHLPDPEDFRQPGIRRAARSCGGRRRPIRRWQYRCQFLKGTAALLVCPGSLRQGAIRICSATLKHLELPIPCLAHPTCGRMLRKVAP